MRTFDRREFLKLMGIAGLAAAFPRPLGLARAAAFDPYDGPLFITIAAGGGWDPTSFCDPKMNVPGAPEINHWARTADTQTLPGSPITYAPFANNEEFFTRFYRDMLVFNGVDTKTNSHDVGVRHTWSGRVPSGYPTFSAIAAAAYGHGLPLPYLTNAGYRESAGLVPYTEVSGARDLQDLVHPNRVSGSDRVYYDEDEMAILESYQRERVDALTVRGDMLPRESSALANLALARASRDQLQSLALAIPQNLVGTNDKDGLGNELLRQAQLALSCCSAGITVACDLEIGGYDTHGMHDASHRTALMRLTNALIYLWDTADSLGLGDRLVVFVASDFGRTPWYNEGDGKDHWPITSSIVMKRSATWGNGVIGESDEGHDALALDPITLEPVSSGGVVPTPAHVHRALRKIAGLDGHPIAQKFEFDVPQLDVPV